MARKSSKSVKLSKKFEFNFEVVLIIVLIIVAIVLICFLNRKYRGVEGFKDKTEAELAAAAKAAAAAEAKAAAEKKAKKRIHFFYATWCTHSMDYINADPDGLDALEAALTNALVQIGSDVAVDTVLIKYDVGAADAAVKKVATDAATKAVVTKLPSFYVVTDGTVELKYVGDYDKFKDETVGTVLNGKLVEWLKE